MPRTTSKQTNSDSILHILNCSSLMPSPSRQISAKRCSLAPRLFARSEKNCFASPAGVRTPGRKAPVPGLLVEGILVKVELDFTSNCKLLQFDDKLQLQAQNRNKTEWLLRVGIS